MSATELPVPPHVPVALGAGKAPFEPPEGPTRFSDAPGTEFIYPELAHGSIRLLHLLPDKEQDGPLKCQLFDYPIRSTSDSERACLFEALSYCWGSPEKTNWISIGDFYLPITASLHSALVRLRDKFFGRVIWADAICINQADNEERGRQVQCMAEIYSKANRVIVWLGEAAAGDDNAIQAILEAGEKSSPLARDKLEAVDALLSRPWFRRIWVLQEVAAARNLRIICGSTEIDGYAFSLCLEALPVMRNRLSSVTYLMKPSIFRPRYKIDHTGRISLGICPLGGLLDMYHAHEATDRRDKVFALLGMSSDDPVAADAAGLSPDYTISWEQLLKRLVEFILGRQVSVRTQPDQEMAFIEGHGCVLGAVSLASEQRVRITPQTEIVPREWHAQPSVKSVRAGDIVCLLRGASAPMIIRPRKDHFSVIAMSVTALGSTMGDIETGGCQQNALPPFQYQFLLVWTWQTPQADWHQDELEGTAPLISNMRIRNTALILQESELHGEAEARYGAIGETSLSELYDHIVEGIEVKQMQHWRDVLLAALLAYRPLSILELGFVAGLEPDVRLGIIVKECGLLLVTKNQTVRLAHGSVKGYLGTVFHPAEVQQGHMAIFKRSIDGISRLKQNIYDLKNDYRPEDIALPDPDPLLPMQYSCLYWGDHLMEQSNWQEKAWLFLKDHFLRWVECLSALQSFNKGIQLIRNLRRSAQIQPCGNQQLTGFLDDAEQFLLRRDRLDIHVPSKIYGSAIIFSPLMSEIRRHQWKEKAPFIVNASGVRDDWDTTCFGVLYGHRRSICALVFSPDGRTLASASPSPENHEVRLWDVESGADMEPLEKFEWPDGSILGVAFSTGGRTLTLSSGDGTVWIRDLETSMCRRTLLTFDKDLGTVAFSPDGRTIVSTAATTFQLWGIETGTCRQTLQRHKDDVVTIAFSPDGGTLAWTSSDGKVWLLDVQTGEYREILHGTDDNGASAIALSSDGRTLAIGLRDWGVRLYDVETDTDRETLYEETIWENDESVSALAFSPDGRRLASGLGDGTVRIWDLGKNRKAPMDQSDRRSELPSPGDCPQETEQHLTKSMGDLSISDGPEVLHQQQPGGLRVDDGEWVTRNGEHLLWIPDDYRRGSVSVQGDTLVLDYAPGRRALVQFDFSAK